MFIAKVNEAVVGSIFGPSGRVLRELENRYKLIVDAHKLSDDRKFRLISITGNIINTCGFLYEIGELVGSANIIISPKIVGRVYVYAQSLLNPINSNGSRPPEKMFNKQRRNQKRERNNLKEQIFFKLIF
ncbi:hypothetical protein ACKWTF_013346 [Chironomus riparius]